MDCSRPLDGIEKWHDCLCLWQSIKVELDHTIREDGYKEFFV